MDDDRLLAELDEFVAGAPLDSWGDGAAVDAEPPQVEDEAGANRLLRAIGRLNLDEQRVRQVVADEVARLRFFESDRCAGLIARREWLERSLEGWLDGQPANVKTVKLPNGELRRRAPRQRVEVLDVDAVRAVAPNVTRTTVDVMKTAVTEELEVGDVIEGAATEPGYQVHAAQLVDRDTGELTVVPGVVFLIGAPGATVFGYTARLR